MLIGESKEKKSIGEVTSALRGGGAGGPWGFVTSVRRVGAKKISIVGLQARVYVIGGTGTGVFDGGTGTGDYDGSSRAGFRIGNAILGARGGGLR